MVDRVAIFSELTERNALRRAAKLPLLDLQAEYKAACQKAELDAYDTFCEVRVEAERAIRETLAEELSAELGKKPGLAAARPHADGRQR
jgi:hypothetical protein